MKSCSSLTLFLLSLIALLDEKTKAMSTVWPEVTAQTCYILREKCGQDPCVESARGILRYNFDNKYLEVCDGRNWIIKEHEDGKTGRVKLGSSKDNPGNGCKHLYERGITTSGVYWLLPFGASQAFQAYCDQATDGGGWMLLYAYKHVAQDNNPVVEKLPTDLNGYSHQLLNNLGINPSWAKELRFYCTTSAHSRVIHFKTSNSRIISTAYDGKGHCIVHDWKSNTFPLSGHSGFLPLQTANVFASRRPSPGFTDFPFWKGGLYHWGISPDFQRFECDDYASHQQHHTLHRVFVRG